MACRRRRRLLGYLPPGHVMRIPQLSLVVAVVMAAVVVAVAPTHEIAAAFRGTDAVVGIRPAPWGGSVRRRYKEDRGGRYLRVGIIDDVVERDEGRKEASGGEGAAEEKPETDVSSGDANATETAFVDVALPPFSLVLALDVPPAEYQSGGGHNSSAPDVAVEAARNDGGEDEDDPSSTAAELNLNHTIVEEVETVTEIYLLDRLSVLLAPILPPSVVIEDVVLNVTTVEVLPPSPSADYGAGRERRRVLRTWLAAKAANDDEEEKDEGEELASQLRIKMYFEGFVRFSVTIAASSSNNSTAVTGPLPSEATLRRALRTALRRALRTALSGSSLNDPEDDGSLLNLLRNGGVENWDEVDGEDEASHSDGDMAAAIELSTVTEITGSLEAPPRPPSSLPPGPMLPPPSPVGGVGDADGIEDTTNTTVGDGGGADDDEQPPPRPQPPSQGDGDAANGNSTTEEDGGPSQGGGTTSGGSNSTSVGADEGEKEEREPIAEESGGPVNGGANVTDTDTNTTNGTEEDDDEEGKQEQSGNTTIVGDGGGNATVNGTIGDGGVESEDPSGGDDASTGSPPPADGGGTVMSAGIIAVISMAAVAVVGELFILSVSAYRGRRQRKKSPPSESGVEGEDSSKDPTTMKVHVAVGDLAGRGAADGQRPGRSFDTFDSDATGNTIDVAAPLGAAAALRTGGASDDGPVEGKSKLAHYDVSCAVAGLDGGLDHDLDGVGGDVEGGQSDVEIGDGSASSVVETVEKDADVVEDSPQDDGSTNLSSSDERTHGANDDDVEKEDRVEDEDVVVGLNDSAGTEHAHVSEKDEDGTSADTPAADRGIEFEASPVSALAGAVAAATAAVVEETGQHAEDKEDEVVAGTTKPPVVDAIPGGEHDPSVPENAPVSPEERSMNGGASELSSGRRDDVAGCTPSSPSSPYEQICQSTSSGASPEEEDVMDVTAMDTVADTKGAMAKCGDDNPDDDVVDTVDTMAHSATETTSATQGSSSPLPAAPRPQEPRQQPLAEPEATGTVDGDASRRRSNKSSSWSIHASNDVSCEQSSDGAASSLKEGSEKEAETKERERSEGERRGEEKKPTMAVKRTLSQLSPQRLVRKAKLLRKSSTSSSIGKTPLSVDDKKDAGCPVDTSRPHDDDSSSGYVDSSVGGAPSDHHKDRHDTHHHGEDSSFDDNSYAFSEGSLAWSYDKVAHPSGLPRAAANDTSVAGNIKDAASDPSKPSRRSTSSLMVDLAEFV